MKLKPMKATARVALLLAIAVSLAFAICSFVNGWQPSSSYAEEIAGQSTRVSMYETEFSVGAAISIILSGVVIVASSTALAVDGLVRKRRIYLLTNTIKQCKEYAASMLKTGMRNNSFFFL
ncbi:MAG: hypothetical protein PHH26_05470 [Candidatus Thermoplasmatota archaeon]|nr:hypothetical protein [Candidatus Thermoplasmatota archaeon]